jgi:hypothetical protein
MIQLLKILFLLELQSIGILMVLLLSVFFLLVLFALHIYGEALATLLAARLAISLGFSSFIL